MRPALAVLVYFTLVFLGGALMAPWVFHSVQFAAEVVPAMKSLSQEPFHRYVNRCLLLLGIIGLWPFFRKVGVQAWRDAGLGKHDNAGALTSQGFALGFASLLCVAVMAVATGGRVLYLRDSAGDMIRHLVSAALSAGVVGIIEELFFRGAILGALRKTFTGPVALALSSVIYATLHLFARPPTPNPVMWLSGFLTLAQMFRGLGDRGQFVPGFFALVLAGWILGLAYQRTGSLYFSIGLHAGWVFWIKTYAGFTREPPGAHAWLWGTRKLIDGWAALLVLGAALVLVRFWFRDPPNALVPRSDRLRRRHEG